MELIDKIIITSIVLTAIFAWMPFSLGEYFNKYYPNTARVIAAFFLASLVTLIVSVFIRIWML